MILTVHYLYNITGPLLLHRLSTCTTRHEGRKEATTMIHFFFFAASKTCGQESMQST